LTRRTVPPTWHCGRTTRRMRLFVWMRACICACVCV
jgi:hypothetical protein